MITPRFPAMPVFLFVDFNEVIVDLNCFFLVLDNAVGVNEVGLELGDLLGVLGVLDAEELKLGRLVKIRARHACSR